MDRATSYSEGDWEASENRGYRSDWERGYPADEERDYRPPSRGYRRDFDNPWGVHHRRDFDYDRGHLGSPEDRWRSGDREFGRMNSWQGSERGYGREREPWEGSQGRGAGREFGPGAAREWDPDYDRRPQGSYGRGRDEYERGPVDDRDRDREIRRGPAVHYPNRGRASVQMGRRDDSYFRDTMRDPAAPWGSEFDDDYPGQQGRSRNSRPYGDDYDNYRYGSGRWGGGRNW